MWISLRERQFGAMEHHNYFIRVLTNVVEGERSSNSSKLAIENLTLVVSPLLNFP
jgi:hypothetical protein